MCSGREGRLPACGCSCHALHHPDPALHCICLVLTQLLSSLLASLQLLAGLPCGLWTCATPSVVPPAPPSVCLLQPMIIASAAFYGILPRAFDFVGLTAAATFIYQLQATGAGEMTATTSSHVLPLNTPDVV